MVKKKIKIIPLGGLGEIGKNMMVVEFDEDIIIIDAGLMFPNEEMLGIDLEETITGALTVLGQHPTTRSVRVRVNDTYDITY